MHNGDALVSGLRSKGVRLWAADGRLHFSAPKGVLSADDREHLRIHKTAVIEALEQAELLRGFSSRPHPADEPLSLTALQLRKWRYVAEHEDGLSERTCFSAQKVVGPLDVAVLRDSLRIVVERHEALRIEFVVLGDTIKQRVSRNRYIDLQPVDLADDRAGATLARQLCEQLVKEKVRLDTGPLFAARVFGLSAHEHVFIFVVDHMISDAVSCQILTEEIWSVYDRIVQGPPCEVRASPLQFLDYVSWQHRTHRAWLAKHEEYWTRRMASAPRRQPCDTSKAPVCEICRIALDATLSARLRDTARHYRTIPALVVLAVVVAALARWLRQGDFILAFVSNGRDRPELQPMIGFLADYLHLRIQIEPTDTFAELLARLTREFHSAYEHQDYGRVPDLVRHCTPQLAFNWVADAGAQAALPAEHRVDVALKREPFPLQLAFPLPPPIEIAPFFSDTAGEIVGGLAYRPDVFPARAVARLVDDIRSLAEAASLRPNDRISTGHWDEPCLQAD